MQTSKCPKCGTTQEYHGTCRVNSDGSEVKMTVWHCGSRQIVEATGEVDWRDGAECKGLAFKAYTHERIDKLGAPHTVEDSEHTKAGCRIGGRFDWVEAELARLKSEKEALERERGARADAASEIIDCLRCVLLQPGNADYEQDARAAIKEYLALLQPAKEVT